MEEIENSMVHEVNVYFCDGKILSKKITINTRGIDLVESSAEYIGIKNYFDYKLLI